MLLLFRRKCARDGRDQIFHALKNTGNITGIRSTTFWSRRFCISRWAWWWWQWWCLLFFGILIILDLNRLNSSSSSSNPLTCGRTFNPNKGRCAVSVSFLLLLLLLLLLLAVELQDIVDVVVVEGAVGASLKLMSCLCQKRCCCRRHNHTTGVSHTTHAHCHSKMYT